MSSSRSLRMELQTLLQDFHSITQVNVSYLPLPPEKRYTRPLHPIASAANAADFLSHLYRFPDWKERAEQMELDAVNQVSLRGEEHGRYHPFPGLTVFVFPVHARSMLLGCLIYGPVRDFSAAAHYQAPAQFRHSNADPDAIQVLYDQFPVLEEAALRASSRLLSQIVVYANNIDASALQSPPLSARIAEYIDMQYMNPISPGTACEHFHISRTTLSRTLSRAFHDTFLSMLNQRRIKHVCQCLAEGRSVEEAATQSGFSSPLYMARVFHRLIGCTPHIYQQTAQQT